MRLRNQSQLSSVWQHWWNADGRMGGRTAIGSSGRRRHTAAALDFTWKLKLTPNWTEFNGIKPGSALMTRTRDTFVIYIWNTRRGCSHSSAIPEAGRTNIRYMRKWPRQWSHYAFGNYSQFQETEEKDRHAPSPRYLLTSINYCCFQLSIQCRDRTASASDGKCDWIGGGVTPGSAATPIDRMWNGNAGRSSWAPTAESSYETEETAQKPTLCWLHAQRKYTRVPPSSLSSTPPPATPYPLSPYGLTNPAIKHPFFQTRLTPDPAISFQLIICLSFSFEKWNFWVEFRREPRRHWTTQHELVSTLELTHSNTWHFFGFSKRASWGKFGEGFPSYSYKRNNNQWSIKEASKKLSPEWARVAFSYIRPWRWIKMFFVSHHLLCISNIEILYIFFQQEHDMENSKRSFDDIHMLKLAFSANKNETFSKLSRKWERVTVITWHSINV